MKKSAFILLSVAGLLSLASCGSQGQKAGDKLITENTADTSFFFGGYYSYMADAATFKDCATGAVIPVSMQGNYPVAEKQYSELDAKGNPVYAEFKGKIVTEPSAEPGKMQVALKIDQVIEFNGLRECKDNSLVAGLYQSQATSNGKAPASSIQLNSDFSFTAKIQGKKDIVEYSGTWLRTFMDEGLLIPDSNPAQRYAFVINYETAGPMLYFPDFEGIQNINFAKK